MSARRSAWFALPLLLAACGDEEPLGVGSELLPPDALRTFELTLEPEQYLLRDTSFAFYSVVGAAEYIMLAEDYAGVLDAHHFVRWEIPRSINVVDSLGGARVDSAYTVLRGEVLVTVDTLATPLTQSVVMAAHALGEEWDPLEADWDFRADGVPWLTPGGTTGALLDTLEVTRDSVLLVVDSAVIRQWADTTNQRRGALLTLRTPGARIRGSQQPRLQIIATSSYHRDTTFTVSLAPFAARNDYRPRAPTTAGDLRVAGNPAWRTFLQLRTDLDKLVVPCGEGCTVALEDVDITRAELVLEPTIPPAGFNPELTVGAFAYEALIAPEFPLPRTPLGSAGDPITPGVPFAPDRFTGDGTPGYLRVTEYIRYLVSGESRSPFVGTGWLALQHQGTPTFGFGTFAPAPRLRLVLSTAREIRLP